MAEKRVAVGADVSQEQLRERTTELWGEACVTWNLLQAAVMCDQSSDEEASAGQSECLYLARDHIKNIRDELETLFWSNDKRQRAWEMERAEGIGNDNDADDLVAEQSLLSYSAPDDTGEAPAEDYKDLERLRGFARRLSRLGYDPRICVPRLLQWVEDLDDSLIEAMIRAAGPDGEDRTVPIDLLYRAAHRDGKELNCFNAQHVRPLRECQLFELLENDEACLVLESRKLTAPKRESLIALLKLHRYGELARVMDKVRARDLAEDDAGESEHIARIDELLPRFSEAFLRRLAKRLELSAERGGMPASPAIEPDKYADGTPLAFSAELSYADNEAGRLAEIAKTIDHLIDPYTSGCRTGNGVPEHIGGIVVQLASEVHDDLLDVQKHVHGIRGKLGSLDGWGRVDERHDPSDGADDDTDGQVARSPAEDDEPAEPELAATAAAD